MDFVKMHGLGNDFIFMEAGSWEEAAKFQVWSSRLCDRHTGIGADGLVVIGKDNKMDAFMRIFNSDGSEAEMCGNGIRCVGRYVYERKWTGAQQLSVRTMAGPRYPLVQIEKGKVKSVQVDMGQPILERALIPMQGLNKDSRESIRVGEKQFNITGVSMGNPHCVLFIPDIGRAEVKQLGPVLEKHPLFPAKTNVEFVQILNRQEMIMRVWERGAGITMACGTGACASLAAAVLNGYSDRRAIVHLLGGDLLIEWSEKDQHVYMTGPATEVFSGSIDLIEP